MTQGRRMLASLRGLPMRRLVIFGVAVAAAIVFVEIAEEVVEGNADPIDRAIALAMHRLDSGPLDTVMRTITHAGSWPAIAVAVAGSCIWALHRRNRAAALVFVVNALIAEGSNSLLKLLFARRRPNLFDELAIPASYSFPSGHAMMSTAVYGTIAVIVIALRARHRAVTTAGVVLLVLAVGTSRVYLGVHWPTDVVAGFAAGIPFIFASHLVVRHSESGADAPFVPERS